MVLTQGIAEEYRKFVEQPGEFNSNILSCSDADYAVSIVNELLKEDVRIVHHNDNGACQSIEIDFEGDIYGLHIFRHYAKVVTATTRVNLDIKDVNNLFIFCNEINKVDKIHQVAFFEDENGNLSLDVKRQFMFSQSVGNLDTLKQGLRDLKEYATNLINVKNETYADEWKKYAEKDNKSIHSSIHSADQEWFPEDTDNVMRPFTKKTKIIHESNSETVHEMINILANGYCIRFGNNACMIGQANVPNSSITTFKEFPLLLTMQATVKNQKYRKINKEQALQLCEGWNRALHFSLSRIVFSEDPNGEIELTLIMSGLFGEELNTRTFTDFLGTMHKTVALLMGTKETSK